MFSVNSEWGGGFTKLANASPTRGSETKGKTRESVVLLGEQRHFRYSDVAFVNFEEVFQRHLETRFVAVLFQAVLNRV